ncbi:MAG: HEAT repeat domain-containing protein [Nitrospirae bacterium]|nr:HEAT repeat domain-containing protein [Nitrospirota bacterium]
MKKTIFIFIMLLVSIFPSLSDAGFLGPYTGQVIDSQTGEPVEGASVLIYWEKLVPYIMQSSTELIEVKLVYTENNGKYEIPRIFANLGLMSRLESTNVIIYQPGYQAYIMKIWDDNPYSKPDPSFKEKNNVVKLDRIPPMFDHKEHYEKIDDALEGIDVYPPYSYTADSGMPWEKVFEIFLKTHAKDQLLRRVEWEGKRGDSLSGISCFPPDKAGYFEKWSKFLTNGNSKEKVSALYNFPCVDCCKTDSGFNVITLITNAIKDSDPFVREEAVSSLVRIKRFSEKCCKETDIVPELINTLNDKSPAVRAEAAKALGYYKDKRAVEPLINSLKDKDPWVRINAASALGELGVKQAVDALLNLIDDNSDWRNKFVQQECILALRKIGSRTGIGDRKVISVLMKHFNDEYLKAEIIITLGLFQAEAASDLLAIAATDSNERIRKLALEAMLRLPRGGIQTKQTGDLNIDIYIKSLKDPSVEVRVQSINGLGRSYSKRAVDPLIEALDDSSEKVRQAAITALGNFVDERILDALIKHFGSSAAKSFLSIAKKASKKKIYIYIKDGTRHVTNNLHELPTGVSITEHIVYPTAVDKLIDGLNNSGQNISFNVLEIIENFEDERIEPLLIKFLDDPNYLLRQKASNILSRIGTDRAVPKLLVALNDQNGSIRAEAANTLGIIKDKRALDPLIERLNDTDDNVRATALSSLGKFNDPRIIDLNIKMLQDKSTHVRGHAIYNIREKPDKRAVEFLIPLLNDLKAQYIAAEALGKCADTRAVDPLIKALKGDGRSIFRESVAKALGLIRDRKAVPTLIEIVSDQKEALNMRSTAAISLGDIGDSSTLEALNNILNEIKPPFHRDAKEAIEKLQGDVKEAIKKIQSQQGNNK